MLISDVWLFVYCLCIPFHFNNFYVKAPKCNYFSQLAKPPWISRGSGPVLICEGSLAVTRIVLLISDGRGKHWASFWAQKGRLAGVKHRSAWVRDGVVAVWCIQASLSPLSPLHTENRDTETLKREPLSRQLTKKSTKAVSHFSLHWLFRGTYMHSHMHLLRY